MADEVLLYEKIRNQRLLENKKRFEDLGISKICKGLSEITKPEKKSQPRQNKPKIEVLEPRRSSRARNKVVSYQDEVDIGRPLVRKRTKLNSSWASYLARPLAEVKTASYEERTRALDLATKIQSNLESENPSFVKSMVRSHVYSCFWLGLPFQFCKAHLEKGNEHMVLENEEGAEYDANYIGQRSGLSGGWRAFALEHKLDDGDALVFELVEKTRFKIYIVKASDSKNGDEELDEDEEENNGVSMLTLGETGEVGKKRKSQPKGSTKVKENGKKSKSQLKSLKKVNENGNPSKSQPKSSTKLKENVDVARRSSTRLRNRN